MEKLRIAEIPVEELIGESWESVLHRLTEDMDPWDIDLSVLARRFRDYLRALQTLRFEIPGRMVLACSILLRMKSDDLLRAEHASEREGLITDIEEEIEEAIGPGDSDEPVVPEGLSLPLFRHPRRQVTLLDLRRALQAAMTVSRRRAERLIHQIDVEEDDPFENFEIGGTDFSERLRALLERIARLLSGRRVLSFFRLLDRGDKAERVQRFFEVLHLAAEGRISCTQKEFLGDILIRLGTEP